VVCLGGCICYFWSVAASSESSKPTDEKDIPDDSAEPTAHTHRTESLRFESIKLGIEADSSTKQDNKATIAEGIPLPKVDETSDSEASFQETEAIEPDITEQDPEDEVDSTIQDRPVSEQLSSRSPTSR
jgi:hypothetical protein